MDGKGGQGVEDLFAVHETCWGPRLRTIYQSKPIGDARRGFTAVCAGAFWF